MSNFHLRYFYFIGVIIFLASSCKVQKVQDEKSKAHKIWKQDRIDYLKETFGWHSLTGLYWLKDDSLSVGTKEGFDINLHYDASANMGTIIHKNNSWFFNPAQSNLIKHNEKYLSAEIELQHDQTGDPTILNYESLFWYVIKREENYGIRLKDTLNPARLEFNYIPTFDFDPNYYKSADVKWASAKDSILITNAQGVVSSNALAGWLNFEHLGKTYSLAGISGGDDTWFVVFGDETNSGSTYGAGRFLYVPVRQGANTTVLDFNRAENPPCYFTEFATCPLPPKENKLPIEIRAGEQAKH